jgi:shikimate dehydrogenase
MSVARPPIHTLADLEAWSVAGTGLAVIGQPVGHSLSPVIHNAALAAIAGEDARFRAWRYHKFEIAPADLDRAVKLFHQKGFAGLNVTVPHKEAVLDHAEGGDALTRAVGAANTLIRTETGWRASNTDCGGLADALNAELDTDLAGTHVIVLGAGGAARAAAVQCLRDKAASLWIGNRGSGRLDVLLAYLAPLAGVVPVRGFPLDQPPADMPAGALVINATTLGLRTSDPAPVDLRRLPAPARVYDMLYNPPVTALLRQAAALGLPSANGLSMLVHQGARSLSLWLGRPVPVEVMRRAAQTALATLSA